MMGYNRVTPRLTSSMAGLIVREQSDGCAKPPLQDCTLQRLETSWTPAVLLARVRVWDKRALEQDVAPR
jgi:hypothetical protein